ncbi:MULTISPECIES: hypothetical protein [unclassified Saccharibacter]|uniref:hypothetical protein n=1 Tax=unclassified Saccharibacter TaxID=2648722 RepID=UPI00132B6E2B|nr:MULTISPECIES: hypothetical protein [unclassified Saccharibacter]MXV35667.1 hypothetical protein [Saccharibacter sp. EH611]MXV58281.1 hypothetical protein [Saccharibacter sp. EH70]MXV66422.1 hypothetical protein [Saccharibacter sp. EH60]
MNFPTNNLDLSTLGEEIASKMSRSFLQKGRIFIETPFLFPSGSYLVISIEPFPGNRFRISDNLQGYEEIGKEEMASSYLSHLRNFAHVSGLSTNGAELFLEVKGEKKLKGAVCALGSNVLRVVQHTYALFEEKRGKLIENILLGRLGNIFGPDKVKKHEKVMGASTHKWKVSALVQHEGSRIIFDTVSNAAVSMAFASTKFTDLASSDHEFYNVAVLDNNKKYGDMINVVSQSASILTVNSNDNDYLNATKMLH